MDRDIAKMWADELRNGGRKQIKGRLCRDLGSGERGFCCLGVLADIMGALEEDGRDEDGKVHYSLSGNGNHTTLSGWPESPITFSGYFHEKGYTETVKKVYTSAGLYSSLVEMNDEGVPFDVIADVIEEHQDLL